MSKRATGLLRLLLLKALPGKASQYSKISNVSALSNSLTLGQEQHRQLLQAEEMFKTCIVENYSDALCCHCLPLSVGQGCGHVTLYDDKHYTICRQHAHLMQHTWCIILSHLLKAQAHPEQTDLCAWAWAGAAHTGRRCCWAQAASTDSGRRVELLSQSLPPTLQVTLGFTPLMGLRRSSLVPYRGHISKYTGHKWVWISLQPQKVDV